MPTFVDQVVGADDQRRGASGGPLGDAAIFDEAHRVRKNTRWNHMVWLAVLVANTLMAACLKRLDVQCVEDQNCNLGPGGLCTTATTGNRWCSYPDTSCQSGRRYSDDDVGDGVSGVCVITSDPGPVAGAPCKNLLVFTDAERLDAQTEVWISGPDGSGAINVSRSDTSLESSPSWSPDGKKVAFSSYFPDRAGNSFDISVVESDGTGLIDLNPDSPLAEGSPVWSPDGMHIAFTAAAQVWVMNTDGADPKQVSQAAISSMPIWSPDSRRLVFDYENDPSTGIDDYLFIATVGQATAPEKLTSATHMAAEREPSWAPAPKIVFTDSINIFTVNADGTDLVNVTQYSAAVVRSPRMTRDGQTIVFSKDEGRGWSYGRFRHEAVWHCSSCTFPSPTLVLVGQPTSRMMARSWLIRTRRRTDQRSGWSVLMAR